MKINHIVTNCRSGKWIGWWPIQQFKYKNPQTGKISLDSRVTDLYAFFENHYFEENKKQKVNWKPFKLQTFGIGVDSGQLGIFDLEKFLQAKKTEKKSEKFYKKCFDPTQGGCLQEGVVSSSGWGDGMYNAYYLKAKEGDIIAIWVPFIDRK